MNYIIGIAVYFGGMLATAAILPAAQSRRPTSKERAFALLLWPLTLIAIMAISVRG